MPRVRDNLRPSSSGKDDPGRLAMVVRAEAHGLKPVATKTLLQQPE
jgi:hypothetical protein